jgi:hypothetical protein
MDDMPSSLPPAGGRQGPASSDGEGGKPSHVRPHAAHAVAWYRWCDGLTEAALYFLVVLGPWAFGTTQAWSIQVVNGGSYFLGFLLAIKWIIRWVLGYQPGRWDAPPPEPRADSTATPRRNQPWLTRILTSLTFLLLAYCLISAWNPRALYDPSTQVLHNIPCLTWLPHSYDPPSTWMVFWQYLGVACVFWATRDWLLGKTRRERFVAYQASTTSSEPARHALSGSAGNPSRSTGEGGQSWGVPDRLKRLLWVLSINGAALAMEGILQRLDGTNKLLWLVLPQINQAPDSQFGPYAYRSNAAQYLNLVWPLCLGFWYLLRHAFQAAKRGRARIGTGAHSVLLPCAVLMAAAPIVSSSRGGALVAVAGWIAALFILQFGTRRSHSGLRLGIGLMFLMIAGLGGFLGWSKLAPRLKSIFTDDMSGRAIIYRNARPMAEEHPVYGTGPGTFCTLYQYYRNDPNQDWAVMAHDDWLETRVTFGWVGAILILGALLSAWAKWFVRGGIKVPGVFVALVWLSLAGCLAHARFDFPFQILSLLFLFILICSILFCSTRKA